MFAFIKYRFKIVSMTETLLLNPLKCYLFLLKTYLFAYKVIHPNIPSKKLGKCLVENRYSHATNTSTSTSQDRPWKLVKQGSAELQPSFKDRVHDTRGHIATYQTDYKLPQGPILPFLMRSRSGLKQTSESVMGKWTGSVLADRINVPCTKTYQVITIISPNMEKNVCLLL